jgi:hypothetical protein
MRSDYAPCKVCGENHRPVVCEQVINLNREIHRENGERERRLREKCRWEHMTRSAVLAEYGDPGEWK